MIQVAPASRRAHSEDISFPTVERDWPLSTAAVLVSAFSVVVAGVSLLIQLKPAILPDALFSSNRVLRVAIVAVVSTLYAFLLQRINTIRGRVITRLVLCKCCRSEKQSANRKIKIKIFHLILSVRQVARPRIPHATAKSQSQSLAAALAITEGSLDD